MKYRVRAIREGHWWALDFEDIDGRIHSQTRRLDQAAAMAADALTMYFEDVDGRVVTADEIDVVGAMGKDVDADDIELDIDFSRQAARQRFGGPTRPADGPGG